MKIVVAFLVGVLLSVGVGAEPVVEGQVRLPDGQPVVGAQVMLIDWDDLRRGAIARATTDAAGRFALPLAGFDRLSPQLSKSGLPSGFALGANYPNPFNPATVIPYELAASAHVRLEVFNLLGQRVATLVDGYQAAGAHTATWTATDAAGRAVSAGVYLYRLTVASTGSADAMSQTGRMVLVDGQAGVAAAAGPGRLMVVGSTGAGERSYGLGVLGAGLVPYVDEDFRVDAGPVAVVVEPGALQPRGKGLSEVEGDVNGDGKVDLFDLLIAALDVSESETEGDGTEAAEGDGTETAEGDGTETAEGDGTETAEPDTSTAAFVDLVVDSLWVERSELMEEESFVLNVRVHNQGTAASDSTTMGFYLSNNTTISTADTPLGSVPVGGLAAADTSTVSLELTAPSRLGTHWVGACVEAVGGEQDEKNNCSAELEITVVISADLVVSVAVSTEAAGYDNRIFPQWLPFTLSALVSNLGTGTAPLTTMHYYSSADSTIGSDDTEIGIASVSSLDVEDARQYSLALSAPAETDTYYYGACVVGVAGELDTDNNCSSGVRVTVIEQAGGTGGTGDGTGGGTGGTGGTGGGDGNDGNGGTGGPLPVCDVSTPLNLYIRLL